jgi:hypothetical protein
MLVVSWTGDEIEYYEGRDLRPDEVAQAFGIMASGRVTERVQLSHGGSPATRSARISKIVVGVIMLSALGIALYSCNSRGRQRHSVQLPATPRTKIPAPSVPLANGAQGALAGRTYTVVNQALVEIGRVGARQDRREYELSNDTGDRALLVQGLSGAPREWHLLLPTAPPPALAGVPAYAAAAQKKGAPVMLGDRTLRVAELFHTKVLSLTGSTAVSTWPAVQYGFVARDADEWLVARWTETGAQFHRGKLVPEAQVLAALGPQPLVEKPR